MVRAKLLLRLGKAKDEKLDDAAEAEDAYRRALEADPANPEALRGAHRPLQEARDASASWSSRWSSASRRRPAWRRSRRRSSRRRSSTTASCNDVDEAVAALKRHPGPGAGRRERRSG